MQLTVKNLIAIVIVGVRVAVVFSQGSNFAAIRKQDRMYMYILKKV